MSVLQEPKIQIKDAQSAAGKYGGLHRRAPATDCSLQRWPVTTLFTPGEDREVSRWNGSSPNASSSSLSSPSSPAPVVSPSATPPPLPSSSPPPLSPLTPPPPPLPTSSPPRSSASSPVEPSAATVSCSAAAAEASSDSEPDDQTRKPERSSRASSAFSEETSSAEKGKTQNKAWRSALSSNVSSPPPPPDSGKKGNRRPRSTAFAAHVPQSSFSSSGSPTHSSSSPSSSSSRSVTFRPNATSTPSHRWREGICLDRVFAAEPEGEKEAKKKEEKEEEEGDKAAAEEEDFKSAVRRFQPPHLRFRFDAEVERAKYMERFRFKHGGKKAKARAMFKKKENGGNFDNSSPRSGSGGGSSDGGSVGLGMELGTRRWISRSLGEGMSSIDGRILNNNFDEESRREYERWKSRATSEFNNTILSASDSAISGFDADDVDDDNGDNGLGWSSSHFSPPDHRQTTFTTFKDSSSNSLDRKRKVSVEPSAVAETHITTTFAQDNAPGKWRIKFDAEGGHDDICTTNIDDLITGSNDETGDGRWSFGQSRDPSGQKRTLTSSEDAWTSVSSLADVTQTPQPQGFNAHEFHSFTPTQADSPEFDSSQNKSTTKEDESIHSADDDTDTDSVFLADGDSESGIRDKTNVSMEMPLRGKSYRTETTSSSMELSAFFPDGGLDRHSAAPWHDIPLTDERSQSDNSVTESSAKEGDETHERSEHNAADDVKPRQNLPPKRAKPDRKNKVAKQHGANSFNKDFFAETSGYGFQDEYSAQNRFQNVSETNFRSVVNNNDNNQTNLTDSPKHVRISPKDSSTDFQGGVLTKDFKKWARKDLMGSPKNMRGSPKLRRSSVKDPLTTVPEVSDGDEEAQVVEELPPGKGVDVADTKTEQQKRLDAWVSSIQTHWDSTGSSVDFPFSFEDSFRGLDNVSDDMFLDFPELEYDDHHVQLFMADDDTRFGFSVIGGYDEGIVPRVDEVTVGSPADRAELEVGDEIVEVNGKCVDRCAHSEIIAHIHQCIQSKAIRLRVKRLKEGEKVPTISKVHDAYIIAVEENARRKLEDASANHRVVPVDLTKPHPLKQEEAVTAFRAEKHQPVGASPPARGTDPTQSQPQQQQFHKGPQRPQELLPLNSHRLKDGLTKTADASVVHPSLKSQHKPTSSPVKPLRQHNHKQHTSQSNTAPPQQQQQQPPTPSSAVASSSSSSFHPHRHNQNQPPPPAYNHHHQHKQQQQQQQPSPLKQHPVSPSGEAETPTPAEPSPAPAPSMPVVAEKKRKSSNHNSPSSSKHGGGLNAQGEAIEMNGMMMMEKERESPQRKGKGGKGRPGSRGSKAVSNPDAPLIEDMVQKSGDGGRAAGTQAPNGKASSHNSLHHVSADEDFRQDMYDEDYYDQDSYGDVVIDTGPHREMAIDCPDSFVATVKTPPRYPPPGPGTTAAAPRVPPTTPSRSVDSVGAGGGGGVRDESGTEATLNDAASAVAAAVSQTRPTTEQLDRLRKHQEELRKRREEESRQQQEQDFLRSSLRESKKLQALENKRMAQMSSPPPPAPVPVGIINTAFVDPEVEEEGGVDDGDEDEGDLVDDLDGGEASVPVERYLKKNAGVEDLLSTLHHIRSRLNSADNTSSSNGSQEVFFLKQLFHNAQFQQAVAMHQKMVEITSRSPQPRPLGTDSQELAGDISGSAPVPRGFEPAMKELVTLLNRPMVKNLLKAHDDVAERQTHPIIQTSESDLIDYPLVQYGEESVKIIHLEKTNEHLGATVKNEGDSVIIARIVKGGAAEKSGLLHEGDEILDVNGIDMRGKNVNEVSEILANMSGIITFMIIPAHTCVEDSIPKPGEIMHLRALFNYDPEDDPYIPCRELGISFRKGDILHAIQLTDPNWWQAHREGEEDHHMLAGLIPSRAFQEQREAIRQQLSTEGKENKKRNRMCACGRKKKKKKKSLYSAGVGEETEEILTYEEVTKYYPQPNRKRPIILVGPPDVGRQELRERIMESDFDRFAATVPHTSRAPAAGEQHGKDYHFISRSVFEVDMLSGKFIEYGEYQGNLYGTSIEAVRQVINQGRICILILQPESLKILRETDLKPYIIFVSPPNMEKLRQLQMALGKPRPTDEQVKELIEKGREMEEAYSHYFDYILVNMDLDRSYTELLNEINRIEAEPQWVPITWVNNGYM